MDAPPFIDLMFKVAKVTTSKGTLNLTCRQKGSPAMLVSSWSLMRISR